MASLIAVEARREATDVEALFYASIVPIIFSGQDLDILFPKMMNVGCVLHYSGFILPWG